jgi:hypothetical protein
MEVLQPRIVLRDHVLVGDRGPLPDPLGEAEDEVA